MSSSPQDRPILADSHCHLHLLQQQSPAQAVANAAASGVEELLCVAVEPSDLEKILPICQSHDKVMATVGLHPNYATEDEPDAERLARMADNDCIAAIGETGLDSFRTDVTAETQQERLAQHVRAARLCGKPLVIHCRDAWDETIALLKKEKAHEVGGVMHCFTGSLANATSSIDMGFMISFSGIVTFRNAEPLRSVARQVPLDAMLLETDCPYLAPEPHRGKHNEPAMMVHTARKMAEIKEVELSAVAGQTTSNYRRLFKASRAIS